MSERDGIRWTRRALLGCAALLIAPAHGAQGTQATALDTYLTGLSTWSGEFTQQVQDERGRQRDAGAGRLVIVRPGKFRWESTIDGQDQPAQLTIADGQNLWSLDYDLEQATVKPQEGVLGQSPAMLLVAGEELRTEFSVTADGRRDGHEWVRVQPKRAESDFREALFGFKGRELAQLVIVDKLGQRATLTFRNVRRNAPVDPALVRFELPAGVDLIGTPVKP